MPSVRPYCKVFDEVILQVIVLVQEILYTHAFESKTKLVYIFL